MPTFGERGCFICSDTITWEGKVCSVFVLGSRVDCQCREFDLVWSCWSRWQVVPPPCGQGRNYWRDWYPNQMVLCPVRMHSLLPNVPRTEGQWVSLWLRFKYRIRKGHGKETTLWQCCYCATFRSNCYRISYYNDITTVAFLIAHVYDRFITVCKSLALNWWTIKGNKITILMLFFLTVIRPINMYNVLIS